MMGDPNPTWRDREKILVKILDQILWHRQFGVIPPPNSFKLNLDAIKIGDPMGLGSIMQNFKSDTILVIEATLRWFGTLEFVEALALPKDIFLAIESWFYLLWD